MNDLILSGKICPYCGNWTEFIDSKEVYGKSYGMMFICRPCDAYVGVHKGTSTAKGRLANRELRDWRKIAHAAFDPIWKAKERRKCRGKAYKWLANELEIEYELCHIGMFDIKTCKRVVDVCENQKL